MFCDVSSRCNRSQGDKNKQLQRDRTFHRECFFTLYLVHRKRYLRWFHDRIQVSTGICVILPSAAWWRIDRRAFSLYGLTILSSSLIVPHDGPQSYLLKRESNGYHNEGCSPLPRQSFDALYHTVWRNIECVGRESGKSSRILRL